MTIAVNRYALIDGAAVGVIDFPVSTNPQKARAFPDRFLTKRTHMSHDSHGNHGKRTDAGLTAICRGTYPFLCVV